MVAVFGSLSLRVSLSFEEGSRRFSARSFRNGFERFLWRFLYIGFGPVNTDFWSGKRGRGEEGLLLTAKRQRGATDSDLGRRAGVMFFYDPSAIDNDDDDDAKEALRQAEASTA